MMTMLLRMLQPDDLQSTPVENQRCSGLLGRENEGVITGHFMVEHML